MSCQVPLPLILLRPEFFLLVDLQDFFSDKGSAPSGLSLTCVTVLCP